MKKIVKEQNFKLIDNCSHYPFVDQQTEFISRIEKWIKLKTNENKEFALGGRK